MEISEFYKDSANRMRNAADNLERLGKENAKLRYAEIDLRKQLKEAQADMLEIDDKLQNALAELKEAQERLAKYNKIIYEIKQIDKQINALQRKP